MSDRLATRLRLVHPLAIPRPDVEAAWRAAGRAFLFAVFYRARDRLLSEGDLP